jgi:hypothetical protein
MRFDHVAFASRTGLSVLAIARLFGVSRRTVTDWSLFGTVPTAYKARYQRILDVVASVGAANPVECRTALLASAPGGSIFHRLLAELPEPQTMQVPGVSVRDRIAL